MAVAVQKSFRNKLLAGAMALVVLAGTALTGVGSAEAFTGQGVNDPKMPSTWRQDTAPFAKSPLGVPGQSGVETMGAAGCAIFSLTALFRKSGSRDENYVAESFRKESVELIGAGKGGSAGIVNYGALNWSGAGAMSGKFTYSHEISHPSPEVLKEQTVDKGYMAVLNVAGVRGADGHYIALDYIDDKNNIWVIDSGAPTDKLNSEVYGSKTFRALFYKMNDGKKNNDLPKLNGMTEGSAAEAGKDAKDKTSKDPERAAQGMLSEDELRGMPEVVPNVMDNFEKVHLPVATDAVVYMAEDMVKGMDERNTVTVASTARGVVSFVGVLVLFWVTLIAVAFAFDKSNTVIEVSAMKIVTLGALKLKPIEDSTAFYSDGDEGKQGKTKEVGVGGIVAVIVLLVLLGGLLLSGALYDLFLNAMWFIEDRQGKGVSL